MTRYSTDQVINSAIALAQAILASDAIERHKREFLSYCVWKVIEADGKYSVRYWSEGVLALVEQYGSLDAVRALRPLPLRHEHMNTRQSLVEAMMKNPAYVERALRVEALACLVTPEEHLRLGNRRRGFDRYRAASIRVWDAVQQDWVTNE